MPSVMAANGSKLIWNPVKPEVETGNGFGHWLCAFTLLRRFFLIHNCIPGTPFNGIV